MVEFIRMVFAPRFSLLLFFYFFWSFSFTQR